jgi:hypothetical protein
MTDQFSKTRPYQCARDGTGEKQTISFATKRYEKGSNFYIATSRIQNEMHLVSLYIKVMPFFLSYMTVCFESVNHLQVD